MIYKNNKEESFFVYFSLIILFLTTFPLALGWITVGVFLPRLLFIFVSLLLFPKSFVSKESMLLAIYFLYYIFAFMAVGKSIDYVGLVAQWMELMIPMLMLSVFFNKRSMSYKTIALFSIIVTITTTLLTLRVAISNPNIVRQMVAFTYNEETSLSHMYRRMGVCSYSFALIMMCMPSVFAFMFFKCRRKWEKYLYAVFSILMIVFLYQSQVTSTFFYGVFMLVVTILSFRMSFLKALIIVGIFIVIFLLFGLIFLNMIMEMVGDDVIGEHIAGLIEFMGGPSVVKKSYDVGERADSYMLSLEAFLSSPIFGAPSAPNGGHNYFLDRLGLFGILGTLPLLLFLQICFKKGFSIISKDSKTTYSLCILFFIILGFSKNFSGIDYWTYMFLYIPCLLKFVEKKTHKVFRYE